MSEIEAANRKMQQVIEQMASEVGTFIGESMEIGAVEGQILATTEFRQQLKNNVILSELLVSGDWSGQAFMVTEAPTAIVLGGKLIMLPEEELSLRLAAKDFDGELADAFGEIINIVTGSLNAEFAEGSSKKLHFIKQEVALETVSKDPSATLPILCGSYYYLVSVPIGLTGKDIGKAWFVLPPAMLDLPIPDEPDITPESSTVGGAAAPPLLLIVAEEKQEGARVAELLGKTNFQVRQVDFQANLREVLQEGEISGALLLMNKVNEQGFAAAIKLRSAMAEATPLIAAGPEWTRESVLQAIKYGACDIIISPVSEKDLLEKLQEYLVKEQG